MKPACTVVRPVIVAAVAEGRGLPRAVRSHSDRCLQCHALEARVRWTRRQLAAVSADDGPGIDLVEGVLAGLRGEPPYRRPGLWRPMAAGTAGIVVALAVLAVRKRLWATA